MGSISDIADLLRYAHLYAGYHTMPKSIEFARRRFIWVQEQPGPVLLLIIALVMMFSVHFFLKEDASAALTDAEQHDAR